MLRIIDGNNRFRAHFETQGPQALSNLYNHSVTFNSDDKVIWVWDAPGGSGARKALYPDYKGATNNIPTDHFFETMKFFKQILRHSNCLQIEVPDFEADDVIAALALGSSQQILIDSNDADFLVLVNDRIQTTKDGLKGVDARHVRLYKTLVGDKSDNIPGLKGLGDKGFVEMADSAKDLLVSHFEGTQTLSGADTIRLCGFKKAQAANWDLMQADLQTFWRIVGFFDLPPELIQQHITAGVHNPLEAQKLLASQLMTMAPTMGAI